MLGLCRKFPATYAGGVKANRHVLYILTHLVFRPSPQPVLQTRQAAHPRINFSNTNYTYWRTIVYLYRSIHYVHFSFTYRLFHSFTGSCVGWEVPRITCSVGEVSVNVVYVSSSSSSFWRHVLPQDIPGVTKVLSQCYKGAEGVLQRCYCVVGSR